MIVLPDIFDAVEDDGEWDVVFIVDDGEFGMYVHSLRVADRV